VRPPELDCEDENSSADEQRAHQDEEEKKKAVGDPKAEGLVDQARLFGH
jgi:hypothetical protein